MEDPKVCMPPIKLGTNEELRNYIDAACETHNGQLISASEVLRNEIIMRFEKAIAKLYKKDKFLLKHKMNEVTICGRLALYLRFYRI